MTCKCCGLEFDHTKNDIPPKWYGKYRGGVLLELICAACLATPRGRDIWDV